MKTSKHLMKHLSVTALAVMALSTSALAAPGTVTTSSGTLRMREDSNTSSAILANIPSGTQVEVSAVAENGWYQVSYSGKEGFVSQDYVTMDAEDASALPVVKDPVFGHVVSGPLNVRSGPSTATTAVTIVPKGTVMEVMETLPGWYQVEEGYISADYVELVTKDEAKALTQTPSTGAQAVVDYAMQFLGCRYVYGGTTPSGFDCSGFTQYVYKQFGVTINRTSRDQIYNGVGVSRSDLQPGDILLFARYGTTISHVGLYIGNNEMIHASSSTTGVIISNINSGYYVSGFVGARRLM